MTYRYLTGLADVCRQAGLKTIEVDGWKTRGRPASTGGFNPVGVLCHHTATSKASSDSAVVSLLIRGRSDLPGPLCQLGLARDGTVYVIAAGRANHAGSAKSSGTVAAGDGNSLYIGIEAFNDGRGEPWPEAQYDAYVKLCAALCLKVTGNSVNTVRGHKETSVTGKIDPTFSMDVFRGRVDAAMRAERPTKPPTPPKPAPKPNPEPNPTDPDGWRFGLLNVKSVPRMPTEHAKSDIALMATTAGVIGWSEIEPPDYKAHVRALDPERYQTVQLEVEVPITVRRGAWEIVDHGRVMAHKGRATVSPSRWITWAKLRNVKTGAEVVFVSTHMISGAWTPKFRTFKGWRRKRWNEHHAAMSKLIAGFVDQGLSVIYGGDLNRVTVPPFHPRQQVVWNKGIDKMFYVEAACGATVEVNSAESSRDGLHSDHPAVRGWLKIRPAK